MPGGRHAYMPAAKVWFLPRSMRVPSRIQTSSQKSCVMVPEVSTPGAKRSNRVTSPDCGSWLRIFSSTPGPPAPPVADPVTGRQGRWSGRKNSSSGLGMSATPCRFQQRLDEATAGRAAEVPRPDGAPYEAALPVDEVHGGRPEHSVDAPGDVPAGVQQDRRRVPALGHRAPDEGRVLAEAHEQDLEALGPQVVVQPVDGRQLLPAVGSPRGPEEQQHDLAAEILQAHALAAEVGQGEGGRRPRRLVGHDLHAREVRSRRGRAGGDGQPRRRGQCRQEPPHPPPALLSASSTSSALRRSSGFDWTFAYRTTPWRSMMKYARLA